MSQPQQKAFERLGADGDIVPKDIGPALKELAKAWQETNAILKHDAPDRIFLTGVAEGFAGGFVAALLLALLVKRRN